MIVDLYAGPGGWDHAAHALGLKPLGVEIDDAACATRRARGLHTLRGDVFALDPQQVAIQSHRLELPATRDAVVPFLGGNLEGLIASPPCQAFSTAGAGHGRSELDMVLDLADGIARGEDRRAELLHAEGEAPDGALFGYAVTDPRALHVVEPLRWAIATRPVWIALEQVPPVLPVWERIAEHLEALGYSAWCGVLSAEEYGVPQTRKRAILIARRDGITARAPRPTHTAYRKGQPRQVGDLLPWVSMADALGWPEGITVVSGQRSEVQRGVNVPHERSADAPAPTVMSNADRWQFRQSNQENATVRRLDEPAPTLLFGRRANEVTFEPVPVEYDSRQQRDGRTGELNRRRSIDEPAPTIAAQSRNDSWVYDRPATTVVCDPRIWPPGHKINADDIAAGRDELDRAGSQAIRVTPEQAAVLQSFPADYPWQGGRGKVFEQIGNAVPPGLAAAVIGEVLG